MTRNVPEFRLHLLSIRPHASEPLKKRFFVQIGSESRYRRQQYADDWHTITDIGTGKLALGQP
jgi:hypothetical protein